MKTKVERNRNLLGRAVNWYTATLEGTGWSATAPTKEEAVEKLRVSLQRQNEWSQTRRYLQHGETVFALFYAQGWQYDITSPDRAYPSSCMLSADYSYAQALQAMTDHFNAYVADQASQTA